MVMDPRYAEFPDEVTDYGFGDDVGLLGIEPSSYIINGFKFRDEVVDLSFLDIPKHPAHTDPGYNTNSTTTSSSGGSEMNSPDDFSGGVLKFLNQILMEDKIDEKPSMFPDPLALRETEKSLYDVLGREYAPSPYRPPVEGGYQNVESPSDYFAGSPSECSTSSGTSDGNYYEPSQWGGESLELKSAIPQFQPPQYTSSSNSSESRSQWSIASEDSISNNINGSLESSMSTHVLQNIFSDSDSILNYKKGMEEASKFLPSSTQLFGNLGNYQLPSHIKKLPPPPQVKVEYDEEISPVISRGRKQYHRQDSFIEDERSSKQAAVYEEEVEISEMFDKVLLCGPSCCALEEPIEESPTSRQENGSRRGSNGGKSRYKRPDSDTEAIDLRTLLINCAQSVAAEDRKTAYEQLKLIRQHSSASGDASQRLADIFADGLEARMAGTGSQLYAALSSRRISATEKLKAFEVYLQACPFQKLSVVLANKMILEKASNATTLHVIDFGIQYGFQWPFLIQLLSQRPGGPPNLRITGIELPQPGFRPAEYMEGTGRRLRSYCERFNVPFEYNGIATQRWEAITVEELKVQRNEVVAVNCSLRFKNLLDETVTVNSPRDAVLRLIRKVNPNIFVHSVVNGSYSAPYFLTRFKEALFHYSAVFDIFETTMPHDDPQILNFEREFSGREVMNVVACEGAQRVERPETHKQWQARITKAGFKPLPFNPGLLKKLKQKARLEYHRDFLFDEDAQWMLVGWKGRVLYGASAWEPA